MEKQKLDAAVGPISTSRSVFMALHNRKTRAIAVAAHAALAFALTGCGMSSTNGNGIQQTAAAPKGAMHGAVHGGQNPVTGASVYLYAVGTTGYGSPSSSLLAAAANTTKDGNGNYYVTTDGTGSFSITGDYSCPTSTSLVYVLSVGGDSGSGTSNPVLYLMEALGNCQTLLANAATTNVIVNENSTVAAAYALAPFMNSATAVGAPGSNLAGITNAFTEISNIFNASAGMPNQTSTGGNGKIPYALMNTLANTLAVCVNSSGAVDNTGTTPCDQVFGATTYIGAQPVNTLMAALSMAAHPANNVSAIVQMGTATSPFQPTVAAANDLTISVAYGGNGISTPQGVAIDAQGNAWVVSANNAVTELSAGSGAALSGSVGYTNASSGFTASTLDAPTSVAIDAVNNVWITNCGEACSGSSNPSSIAILAVNSTTGTVIGASSLTNSTLLSPYGIAIDGVSGNAWVANALGTGASIFTSTAFENSLTGTFQSNSTAVAIDANEVTYVLSPGNNSISAFRAGAYAVSLSYQGSGVSYPMAAAVDATNRVWVVNQSGNSLSVLSGGVLTGGSPYTGGGLSAPNGIALDGSGDAWVSDGGVAISALSGSGTPLSASTGFQPGASYTNGIAVDGSGNVWVTDCGSYCTGSGTSTGGVYQMIGAATPVLTPIALGVKSQKLATEP